MFNSTIRERKIIYMNFKHYITHLYIYNRLPVLPTKTPIINLRHQQTCLTVQVHGNMIIDELSSTALADSSDPDLPLLSLDGVYRIWVQRIVELFCSSPLQLYELGEILILRIPAEEPPQI